MFYAKNKIKSITKEEALPGRDTPLEIEPLHFVNKNPLKGPYPEASEEITFGMGCFWGAERRFWEQKGVWVTAVGYAEGYTPNPTYEEVCTGLTFHNEVVKVVFEPEIISLEEVLKVFWQSHIPTQGMRQGNDIGTQYRSGIYCSTEQQLEVAKAGRERLQAELSKVGYGAITTEIKMAGPFYFAETGHQQYLAKNPAGYCNLKGTGVTYK